MVEIIPYQPRWADEFRTIAATLRRGLGPLALRIDHIGSTSVAGLAAKDIIDVQITVAALCEDALAAMEAIGYTLPEIPYRDHRPPLAEGPESDWQKWLFRPPAGQRPPNPTCACRGAPTSATRALSRLSARPPRHRRGVCGTQAPPGPTPGRPKDVP
jgi:GrpB-like predicted nucleotidyltransferase (UPF0157 family)